MARKKELVKTHVGFTVDLSVKTALEQIECSSRSRFVNELLKKKLKIK